MKKVVVLIISILIIASMLCGCQHQASQSEEYEKNISKSLDKDNTMNSKIETVICSQNIESAEIFNSEKVSEFAADEYTDEKAPQSMSVEIFEKSYDLKYKNSVTLPRSDLNVHVYNYSDNTGYVYIDAESGEVVKATNIPYEEELSTEEDYINAINNMFGEKCDLSQYGYKNVSTHIYRFSEGGVESTTVDGFYNCGENEKFGWYTFYYQKTVGNIKTLEHLTVEFSEKNTLSFEFVDLNYDIDLFGQIIDNIELFDNSIEACLNSSLKDKYKIKDILQAEKQLFIKNDVPYIFVTCKVTVTQDEYEGEFVTVVSTVSRYTE